MKTYDTDCQGTPGSGYVGVKARGQDVRPRYAAVPDETRTLKDASTFVAKEGSR